MEIYNHDNPETISFKNNYVELNTWISHLEYIDKEIRNLLNLGKTELVNILESQPVLLKLSIKKEENRINLKAFVNYKNGLFQAAECEDVDCDMFFIIEHERYRKLYIDHLKKYRIIKEEYFNILGK